MKFNSKVCFFLLGITGICFATGAARAESSNFDDTATQVSVGGSSSCVLTSAGGVRCFGKNDSGQLGDDSLVDRSTAVDVSGLSSGVAALASGEHHFCALTTAGGVKCWGLNANGQLGDGTLVSRRTPVAVSGFASGAAAIVAGERHTCALTTGGAVKCWGANLSGQLGDGTTTDRSTPVAVSGLSSGVIAISSGWEHTCALLTGGGVKCWGSSDSGQIGDDSSGVQRLVPVDVTGLGTGVVSIRASGKQTCAITVAGAAKCWGRNRSGQLGDNTNTDRSKPVDVSGLSSGVSHISGGGDHMCAVVAGAAKCWGDNTNGQIGDDSQTERHSPTDVSGLSSGVDEIHGGKSHTCARSAGGGLKCWGDNSGGQLGDDSIARRLRPVDVAGFASGAAAIEAGSWHTCIVTAAGGARCTGRNRAGQLGDNSMTDRSRAVNVSGLASGVAAISAGEDHSCALTAGGAAKCWGSNGMGRLGDGGVTQSLTPVGVLGLASGVLAISAGGSHTCALVTGGGVKCWGNDIFGQLGDNATNPQSSPVNVSGLSSGVTALGAGNDHTCALVAGGVKCWGANDSGQLGNNSNQQSAVPVNVTGLASGVTAIAVGQYHNCALTTGGGVKCWGWNNAGQLGDGTTTNRSTPVDVSGLTSGVTALVAAGRYQSCAIVASGGLKCWGFDYGDGSSQLRLTPVDIPGMASGVVAATAGEGHTCVRTTGGAVKCWGWNSYGQFGDDTLTDRRSPVDVRREHSIAFTPPAQLAVGVASGLSATTSSSLPASFDTWTPDTCTVTGNALTATGVGLCGVRASQAGNGANAAAPQKLGLVAVAPGTTIPRLGNISTRMQVLTGNDVLIGGFIIGGATPKTVVVRARGPSLIPFGITNALADPKLDLYSGQTVIATNDDFGTATNLSAIQASGFAPADAKESAILATLNPGAYTAIVSGAGGGTGVGIVEVFEVDRPEIPLANISTRGQVLTNNDVMIGGFVIQGSAPQTVVVRARGPSLIPFGITNALANPVLQLFSGQTLIASNDDWQAATNAAAITASGFAPSNALESAILVTLNPGAYTAIVTGAGGTTGVGIVEVFAQ